MKIALGQLPARPCSSSFLVLVPNWRISRVSASDVVRVMGEAATRLASRERTRNFMLSSADSEAADEGK